MGIFSFLKGGCIKPIKKQYENELTENLQKGDIILHRASGKFISSLISDFTNSPYSHAEIYIGDGWCVSAEAKGVTFSNKLNKNFVDIMRFKGDLSRDQRGIILEKAYQSLAKPYAFLKLVRFPFYYGPKSVARRAGKVAYICSELTAWCYKEAKIDLIPRLPEEVEAPADIAKSEKLEWKRAWKDAKNVKDAELNVRHRIQGKHHWLARIIIKLIKPLTEAEYERTILHQQEGIRQNLIEEKLKKESLNKEG